MVGARATTRPFPLLPTREHPVFIGKPNLAKNAVEGQYEKERCPWYRVGLVRGVGRTLVIDPNP